MDAADCVVESLESLAERRCHVSRRSDPALRFDDDVRFASRISDDTSQEEWLSAREASERSRKAK